MRRNHEKAWQQYSEHLNEQLTCSDSIADQRDDFTNRSMRSNLIFKGVKEEQGENFNVRHYWSIRTKCGCNY